MVRFGMALGEEELRSETVMPHGDITFYGMPGNKEHSALKRRFHRILGKIATNRNQSFYRLPSRELIRTEDKGSIYWVGKDALRWVRERPERYFLYNAQDWGFRPSD